MALAVACFALLSVIASLQATLYGTMVPLAILLAAGVCAAPLVALTHPRIALIIFCASAFALPLSASPDRDAAWPWPWSVAAQIVFVLFVFILSAAHGWRLAAIAWAIGNAGALIALTITPGTVTPGAASANLTVTLSITAAAVGIGVLVAGRIRVGEELTRSRELTAAEQSRRLLVEERTRIARELHDVVAHGMSVIQVQASTARYRIADLAPEATAEFDDIAASARGSLAEMRRLLGVLRTDDQTQELAPQQGIYDIPALVGSIRRAGVAVTLSLDAPPLDASAAVQVTAFRIAQEALSNAARHAPGAEIDVTVRSTANELTVRVHNEGVGDAAPTATADAGHGLRGMRERVALLAGTLMVGPDPDGGWTVTAVLPWAEPEQETA